MKVRLFDGDDKDCEKTADDLFSDFCDEKDACHFNSEAKETVSLEKAIVGDYVVFGRLIWKVINIEEGKKLLITKEIVNLFDYIEVDEDKIDYTRPYEKVELLGETSICQNEYRWMPSKVRTFLNGDFLSEHFSDNEVSMIIPMFHQYVKNNGEVVEYDDKVCILSKEETINFLPNKEDRIGYFHNIFADNDVKRDYILRLDEEIGYQPFVVDSKGEIELLDKGYVSENCRPVIYVKI